MSATVPSVNLGDVHTIYVDGVFVTIGPTTITLGCGKRTRNSRESVRLRDGILIIRSRKRQQAIDNAFSPDGRCSSKRRRSNSDDSSDDSSDGYWTPPDYGDYSLDGIYVGYGGPLEIPGKTGYYLTNCYGSENPVLCPEALFPEQDVTISHNGVINTRGSPLAWNIVAVADSQVSVRHKIERATYAHDADLRVGVFVAFNGSVNFYEPIDATDVLFIRGEGNDCDTFIQCKEINCESILMAGKPSHAGVTTCDNFELQMEDSTIVTGKERSKYIRSRAP